MKTPAQWFAMYAESHQNDLNKKIHFICVPVIYYTIIGLLLEIPTSLIENTLQLDLPLVENWAVVVAFIVLIFYFLLSFKIFVRMVIFTALCIALNQWIDNFLNNFQISIGLFVIAWIGQFYGHKIEGKKPSFFKIWHYN